MNRKERFKNLDELNVSEALKKFWDELDDDNSELFYRNKKYDVIVQIWYDYDGDLHFHFWSEKGDRLTATMVHEYCEDIEELNSIQLENHIKQVKAKLEKMLKDELDVFLINMTYDSVNDNDSHLSFNEKCEIVQEALKHGYDISVDIDKIETILDSIDKRR